MAKKTEINICNGCEEEIIQAIKHQDEDGYHLATCIDIPTSYPSTYLEDGNHFFILMVDKKANIVIK